MLVGLRMNDCFITFKLSLFIHSIQQKQRTNLQLATPLIRHPSCVHISRMLRKAWHRSAEVDGSPSYREFGDINHSEFPRELFL